MWQNDDRAGWGFGPPGHFTVSPSRLEFVQGSADVHYVFDKPEIDHLRFDYLRIGRNPVHPVKQIYSVLASGEKAPIPVRPIPEEGCFDELRRYAWR